MAWRFKVSKFKNTVPNAAKKEESVHDLQVGFAQINSNGIEASSDWVACNVEGEGGKLGILPLGAKGRRLRSDISILHAHGGPIADFSFAPFGTTVLATASRDDNVKVWSLAEVHPSLPCNLGTPVGTLSGSAAQSPERLAWHSCASGVLAVGGAGRVAVWDAEHGREQTGLAPMEDRLSSLSWHGSGQVLAAIDKASTIALYDPRVAIDPIQTTSGSAGPGRESRVLFLGQEDRLLTTGFSKNRYREILLFDTRKFVSPIRTIQTESSTGVMLPFYDVDTKLIFLVGKGGNKISLFEMSENDPMGVEYLPYSGDAQILGACAVPKPALAVMTGEVARVLLLHRTGILPVHYIVPRRNYRDFHAEIFPDTVGSLPGLSAADWFNGHDQLPPLISLNPASKGQVQKKSIGDVMTSKNEVSAMPSKSDQPSRPASLLKGSQHQTQHQGDNFNRFPAIQNTLHESHLTNGHSVDHTEQSSRESTFHSPSHIPSDRSLYKPIGGFGGFGNMSNRNGLTDHPAHQFGTTIQTKSPIVRSPVSPSSMNTGGWNHLRLNQNDHRTVISVGPISPPEQPNGLSSNDSSLISPTSTSPSSAVTRIHMKRPESVRTHQPQAPEPQARRFGTRGSHHGTSAEAPDVSMSDIRTPAEWAAAQSRDPLYRDKHLFSDFPGVRHSVAAYESPRDPEEFGASNSTARGQVITVSGGGSSSSGGRPGPVGRSGHMVSSRVISLTSPSSENPPLVTEKFCSQELNRGNSVHGSPIQGPRLSTSEAKPVGSGNESVLRGKSNLDSFVPPVDIVPPPRKSWSARERISADPKQSSPMATAHEASSSPLPWVRAHQQKISDKRLIGNEATSTPRQGSDPAPLGDRGHLKGPLQNISSICVRSPTESPSSGHDDTSGGSSVFYSALGSLPQHDSSVLDSDSSLIDKDRSLVDGDSLHSQLPNNHVTNQGKQSNVSARFPSSHLASNGGRDLRLDSSAALDQSHVSAKEARRLSGIDGNAGGSDNSSFGFNTGFLSDTKKLSSTSSAYANGSSGPFPTQSRINSNQSPNIVSPDHTDSIRSPPYTAPAPSGQRQMHSTPDHHVSASAHNSTNGLLDHHHSQHTSQPIQKTLTHGGVDKFNETSAPANQESVAVMNGHVSKTANQLMASFETAWGTTNSRNKTESAPVTGRGHDEAVDVKMRVRPLSPSSGMRPVSARPRTQFGMKTSQFRHSLGTPGGKGSKFLNLRNVNTRIAVEGCGFVVSDHWAAVSVSGTQGFVLILDLAKPDKIPDGVMVGLENGCAVCDMQWSPHRPDRLAVGLTDGRIHMWDIPEGGILTSLTEPSFEIKAHSDKISLIRYHPLVADVLLSVSADGEACVWNTASGQCLVQLDTEEQQFLSFCWSWNGKLLASLARDGCLRIYDPRKSSAALKCANVLDSARGARVLFVLEDRFLLLSCFGRSSERVLKLIDSSDLTELKSLTIDVNPQLLIPHYDYDTGVVFVTSKGDRSIHLHEVIPEEPYFLPLAGFTGSAGHQAISFQSKRLMNVRKVEFARCYRLSLNDVESLSFTVPRKKIDLFQNDVFPHAYATWHATCTAEDWMAGHDQFPLFVNLKPNDMSLLYPEDELQAANAIVETSSFKESPQSSHEPQNNPSVQKITKPARTGPISTSSSNDNTSHPVSNGELMDAITSKFPEADTRLEQDGFEGVEEVEWAEE